MKLNFHFKKRLGQNFLIDNNIVNNIINKANIDEKTLVIEIGTGAGALTNKLVEKAKYVISYEIDTELKDILEPMFKDIDNLKIIYDDFLGRDIIKDIGDYKYNRMMIIGNLPYYITTPIINKIIEDKIPITEMIIMVQKEVAERLIAKPGVKDYNSLSIFIDYYFEVDKLFSVSRHVFIPKPKVDSVVIRLRKRNKAKINVNNERLFFKLVKDAFVFKRKNLRNNLKHYNIDLIESVLKKYNMNSTIRAEDISIDIFAAIANELSK